MPRRASMYLPGYPYHIVQHGNNREACFVEPENYQYYLELWKENAKRYGVKVINGPERYGREGISPAWSKQIVIS